MVFFSWWYGNDRTDSKSFVKASYDVFVGHVELDTRLLRTVSLMTDGDAAFSLEETGSPGQTWFAIAHSPFPTGSAVGR